MKLNCVIHNFTTGNLNTYTCTIFINNVWEKNGKECCPGSSLMKRNISFLIYPYGVYKLWFKRLEKQFGERYRKECRLRGIYKKKYS
jgi:hypothetical protein